MAYKTKAEKRAYKTGLLNGLKRSKKKPGSKQRRNARKPRKYNPLAYRPDMSHDELMFAEHARQQMDLLGFDYDSRGRIKGSYTPDGFFEPD